PRRSRPGGMVDRSARVRTRPTVHRPRRQRRRVRQMRASRAATAAASLPVRRGRPPRLSRAAILDAGLVALEGAPDAPLTVARIAAEINAVPAALYRHFANLDDLLDGILGRVLGAVALEIRPRAAWPGQVRDWMTSLRNHLLRYP